MTSPIQGAFPSAHHTLFRVWAPNTPSLELQVEGGPTLPFEALPGGHFELVAKGVTAGARYRYRFPDGRLRADPASRLQEGSVHEASTVVDLSFPWTDGAWKGVPIEELITYELHVGTFTPEGTLEAIIPRLPKLKELGVTAVELMPLAAFDGTHGWGYDGVLLYAVHAAYGGPRALQRLVDACHAQGLAVILDVVYNHLGPSGNYLRDFGPYFTDKHHTPWGEAINYDAKGSGPVRDYFVENALQWLRDFHVDALRLDAVHGIVDTSKPHILRELNDRVQALGGELGRAVHLIAESDLNDPVVVLPVDDEGHGLAAQWSDDFHHALHTLLTGQRDGYYADYGKVEHLAKVFREVFVLTGQHSVFRKKKHGKPARGLPGRRFVVCAQNHDQIGNRALGERLTALVSHDALRLAATATLLSPFLPLLYMGEEYAEPAPFQYFTSFPDAELGRAVSEGRRREFKDFTWEGELPDPQDPKTFERSHIDFALSERGRHAAMRRFYRAVIALRRSLPALRNDRLEAQRIEELGPHLVVGRGDTLLVLRLTGEAGGLALPAGRWRVRLDSWATEFAEGSAHALPSKIVEGQIALGPWHALLLVAEGA